MNKIILCVRTYLLIFFISGCTGQIADEDVAKKILEASNNIKMSKIFH